MFIISLHDVRPLADVEDHLEARRQFPDKRFQEGVFLMTGRKKPRTGGIILAHAENRPAIERIIAADPFHQAGIARYHITEFVPGRTSPDLAQYQNSPMPSHPGHD